MSLINQDYTLSINVLYLKYKEEHYFNTWTEFLRFLELNPIVNSFLLSIQGRNYHPGGIINAYCAFQERKFKTIRQLKNYLDNNPIHAKSIEYEKRKRSDVKSLTHDFSKRICHAMELKGFTQTKLAKLVGVTQPQIYHYRSGKSIPRPYVLQRLSLTLQVNYEWLRFGHGESKAQIPYDHTQFWKTKEDRLAYLFMVNEVRPVDLENIIAKWTSLISTWLDGSRFPTKEQLKDVADYFNVSEEWIINGQLQ
jgi:transcriptional regulator with XRE-family HTH domain